MNPAMALILVYIVITAILQLSGFLISWFVEMVSPTLSLMTFVVLFVGMFWLGWPIAVRISGAWFPDDNSGSKPGAVG